MREHRKLIIQRIMVATDLSDASYGALNYATQLARCFSAKLLVVHVVDSECTATQPEATRTSLPEQIDAAEKELQKINSALSFDHAESALIVRPGSIREVIMKLIEERGAGLLVIGTRGKGYQNGEGLGSVAEMLLRAMPCPVLTVGKGVHQDACEGTHMRNVLFPTDFSDISRNALVYAESLTTYLRGRLLLLHVDENSAGGNLPHNDEFQMLMRDMDEPFLVAEQITRVGRAAEVIAATSMEKRADFIVMGVHEAKESGRAHNCGIAFDVIRSVKCPVFTLVASSNKETTETPEKEMTEAGEFRLQQQRCSVQHS
jgi:nucleotide-binding universal stress UspA family protein